jgi:predicted ATP-grasp superfamily ATP-dependent carboligase
MDFILRDGVPYLLEVNPRCGASAELFEEALNCSIFDLHVRACRGQLPGSMRKELGGYLGKGILYARRNLQIDCTDHWFDLKLRDIPQNGAWIPKGAPVCTITGSGESVDACWESILEQAQRLRAEIEN